MRKIKLSIEEIKRDWKFSEIEKRSLQFALNKSDKVLYQAWLKRPTWYKEVIRNAPIEQTLIQLVNSLVEKMESMENLIGGSSRLHREPVGVLTDVLLLISKDGQQHKQIVFEVPEAKIGLWHRGMFA